MFGGPCYLHHPEDGGSMVLRNVADRGKRRGKNLWSVACRIDTSTVYVETAEI
jgi:hypothetical protein